MLAQPRCPFEIVSRVRFFFFVQKNQHSFLLPLLSVHREESNRIMREFILGPITTSRILQGKKSEE